MFLTNLLEHIIKRRVNLEVIPGTLRITEWNNTACKGLAHYEVGDTIKTFYWTITANEEITVE